MLANTISPFLQTPSRRRPGPRFLHGRRRHRESKQLPAVSCCRRGASRYSRSSNPHPEGAWTLPRPDRGLGAGESETGRVKYPLPGGSLQGRRKAKISFRGFSVRDALENSQVAALDNSCHHAGAGSRPRGLPRKYFEPAQETVSINVTATIAIVLRDFTQRPLVSLFDHLAHSRKIVDHQFPMVPSMMNLEAQPRTIKDRQRTSPARHGICCRTFGILIGGKNGFLKGGRRDV